MNERRHITTDPINFLKDNNFYQNTSMPTKNLDKMGQIL